MQCRHYPSRAAIGRRLLYWRTRLLILRQHMRRDGCRLTSRYGIAMRLPSIVVSIEYYLRDYTPLLAIRRHWFVILIPFVVGDGHGISPRGISSAHYVMVECRSADVNIGYCRWDGLAIYAKASPREIRWLYGGLANSTRHHWHWLLPYEHVHHRFNMSDDEDEECIGASRECWTILMTGYV